MTWNRFDFASRVVGKLKGFCIIHRWGSFFFFFLYINQEHRVLTVPSCQIAYQTGVGSEVVRRQQSVGWLKFWVHHLRGNESASVLQYSLLFSKKKKNVTVGPSLDPQRKCLNRNLKFFLCEISALKYEQTLPFYRSLFFLDWLIDKYQIWCVCICQSFYM